jgi:hypothetical protein
VKALFTSHAESLPEEAVVVLEGLPASNEETTSMAPLALAALGLVLLVGLLALVGRISQPPGRARTL